MHRDLLPLTWKAFNLAVEHLAFQIETAADDKPEFVFGEPRGGLVLAVALSHALKIPLSLVPGPKVLWVDDIVDSGITLRKARDKEFFGYCCWVTKEAHKGLIFSTWLSGRVDPWIVFPWENHHQALEDMKSYNARRATCKT